MKRQRIVKVIHRGSIHALADEDAANVELACGHRALICWKKHDRKTLAPKAMPKTTICRKCD